MMGDLPRWKVVVSLWWVTHPNGRWWWSHYNGWPTQTEDGLIMTGDLLRWKMKGGLPGKKTWLEKSWQDKAAKLGVSWLQDWHEDSSWWQGWSPHFFEIFLMAGFISFFSHSMIKTDSLLLSTQWFFLYTILLDFIEDFPITIQISVQFFFRLDDMHASLSDLKYRSPPLWCSIAIGCLCLYSKAFFVLSIHWLIHVLAITQL